MTNEAQSEFVIDVLDNIKSNLLQTIAVHKIPENWQGAEMQAWIVDYVAMNKQVARNSQRMRDYSNDVLVGNLI